MKTKFSILPYCYLLVLGILLLVQNAEGQTIDIYKNVFTIPQLEGEKPKFSANVTVENVESFTDVLMQSEYNKIAKALLAYKQENALSDWMYYQMVRRTANYCSAKAQNYNDYTLLKWYLMRYSGYDVRLAVIDQKLLFYTQSNDDVYDIPYFDLNGKRYVCLNRHDFGFIPFETEVIQTVPMPLAKRSLQAFSYKIAHLPEFTKDNFTHRFLDFNYQGKEYHFNIAVNRALDTLFTNYPVVNYDAYFNIPMSEATYNTLIPELKSAITGLSKEEGLEYLMNFTRDAFDYQSDMDATGKEYRNAPELTLLRDKSDCDDRVALLYFLIKEFYDLPMIVVQYPTHVVLAVNDEKLSGYSIPFQSKKYVVLDPTPQSVKYKIGEIGSKYKRQSYEVAYAYKP